MRERLKERVPELRRPDISLPSVEIPGRAKVLGIIGGMALLGVLGAAGVLSGLALFILAVIATNPFHIVGASLLLSFSAGSVLLSYGWFTA